MSTYLTQTIYHRQLQADEVKTAIDAGHGLLVVDKNGDPRFVEQPRTFPLNEFEGAARKGRVHLAWASRWGASDELPENTELAEQCHAEPVEAHTDPQPVTPAAPELATTLQFP